MWEVLSPADPSSTPAVILGNNIYVPVELLCYLPREVVSESVLRFVRKCIFMHSLSLTA